MKTISYDVKFTAQNDLGREWSVIQTIKHDNGNIDRNVLFTSEHKNNRGLLECSELVQKIKTTQM